MKNGRVNQQNYLRKRRKRCLDFFGNRCVQCGGQKKLQFDHIDRSTKKFHISGGIAKHIRWELLVQELAKCQLLCYRCHNLKTIKESGRQIARGNHGTVSSYKYCKCNLCRKAHRDCLERYYETHKRVMIGGRRVAVKI